MHPNSAMPTDLRMVGNTLFNVLLPLAAQILKDQLHKTLIFAVDFKYLWLTRALFPYLDITWYDVVGWLPLDHRKKKVRPMFHGSQSLIPLGITERDSLRLDVPRPGGGEMVGNDIAIGNFFDTPLASGILHGKE